jgi:glutathione S-transferase
MGLPYTVHPIDIGNGEQFKPEFLKISPNNRIPAIVDHENGISLMESGAILIYLADKTGKLLPKSGEAHYRVLEWLMWQMGGKMGSSDPSRSCLAPTPRGAWPVSTCWPVIFVATGGGQAN